MAQLNPTELAILKILWENGAMKPREIQERLEPPIKNSLLRWYLQGLVAQRQVARRKRGKAFYYRAAARPRRVLHGLVRRLADIFCEGSAAALIGLMIESETELSEEEIRSLQRIAERRAGSTRTLRTADEA